MKTLKNIYNTFFGNSTKESYSPQGPVLQSIRVGNDWSKERHQFDLRNIGFKKGYSLTISSANIRLVRNNLTLEEVKDLIYEQLTRPRTIIVDPQNRPTDQFAGVMLAQSPKVKYLTTESELSLV